MFSGFKQITDLNKLAVIQNKVSAVNVPLCYSAWNRTKLITLTYTFIRSSDRTMEN